VCAKEIKPKLNTLDAADFVRDVEKLASEKSAKIKTRHDGRRSRFVGAGSFRRENAS
jgi:hypothetical protein